jgi:type II secretory pathway component PulM
MTELLMRLSPRERWLIAVLLFVVLPLTILLAIIQPLTERRTALAAELEDARALRVWVSDRSAEASALRALDTSAAAAPIGLAALERGLVDADLRKAVSDLSNRAEGGIALRLDRVLFVDFMGWLSTAERNWGYAINQMRVEDDPEPGFVSVELQLRPL